LLKLVRTGIKTMLDTGLRSKIKKAILQPYKIPGYLKRKVESILNTVEGSRIIWPAPGRALLETFQTYRPRGDEMLVLTQATLVSAGTEKAMFAAQPHTNVQFPYYPGYAGAGQVLMVGDQVTRFQAGDQVAGGMGFFHASLNMLKEEQVVPIPQGTSMAEACFVQLGAIALQGVRKAQIQLGESVAILGPGLIGQIAIQLVVATGAYPVTVVASSSRRLPLAKENGAHATLSLAEEQEALGDIQADVTIEATGNPAAIHDAIRCTRPGGRIVLLGSNRGITHEVDFDRIRRARITLIGAHIMSLPQAERWPGWWPENKERETIMQLLSPSDGRVRVDNLITDELQPSEPELFYRRLVSGDRSILAAIFCWDRLPEERRFAAPRREALTQGRVYEAVRRTPAGARHSPKPSSAPLSSVSTATNQTDGQLRIGLIGCGEIAMANAKAVQDAPNASIATAMDVNPTIAEDMGKRYSVPFTTNMNELLARDDVDAVLISVPHHLHAPLTIQAARQGKHVMIEKPMTTTVTDADAMIAACQEAGVKLSVIYCQRYLPYVQKARELIQSQAIGKLLGLNLTHYLDKPVGYWTGGRTGRVTTDWRLSKEKSGGGVLVFNLVHYLDMLRYLTGLEVTRVYSEYDTFDSPVETEDTISISLRYGESATSSNGNGRHLVGNITAASCVRGAGLSHQQLYIWGTEGQIIVGEPFKFYSLRQVEDYNPGEWHTLTEWQWGIERKQYVQHFATAVLRGDQPAISGQDGRAVQVIVDAVYASQELGKPIEIEAM
jgi:2-desacetyl-2-hydroxyethyl bacteriochlorophyllide A dehydrogenase